MERSRPARRPNMEMAESAKNIKLNRLKPGVLDQAVAVFLEAFKKEAFTKTLLDLNNQKHYNLYFKAVKYKVSLYLETGQLVFSVQDNDKEGRVAGLFILRSPQIKAPTGLSIRRIIPVLPSFAMLLPNYLRAAQLGQAVKPPEDLPGGHYALEGLAVAPEYQGQGLARMMLEKADQVATRDESSPGIYLYTGDEKNRAIYERFAYKVLKTVPTRSFTAYHMFKWTKQFSGS